MSDKKSHLYRQQLLAMVLDVGSDEYEQGIARLDACKAYYKAASTRMTVDTPEEREKKGAEVKKLGVAIVAAWCAAFSKEELPLYFHLGADHSEEMIIENGDLKDYSIDQLEAIHAVRKRLARNFSNKRKGVIKSRLYQTQMFEIVGKIVAKKIAFRRESRYQQDERARLK